MKSVGEFMEKKYAEYLDLRFSHTTSNLTIQVKLFENIINRGRCYVEIIYAQSGTLLQQCECNIDNRHTIKTHSDSSLIRDIK